MESIKSIQVNASTVLDLLNNVISYFQISPSLIPRMLNLRNIYGQPLLQISDRESIFNFLTQIQSDAELITYFEQNSSKINPEDLLWNSPYFNDEQQQEYLDAEFMLNRNKVKSGLICRRPGCMSDNVIYVEKQTRSADESATIIARCLTCSNIWTTD